MWFSAPLYMDNEVASTHIVMWLGKVEDGKIVQKNY